MHEFHIFSNEESPLSKIASVGDVLPAPQPPRAAGAISQPQPTAVREIRERMNQFQRALEEGDLEALMDLYAHNYRDSLGRGRSYVRLCYEWFFRRYDYPGSIFDLYGWDLSPLESANTVNCHIYTFIIGNSTVEENFLDVVFIPRGEGVIEFGWRKIGGKWRIVHTDPPLPDLDQLLIYST